MPAQGFTQYVRRVAANSAGFVEVIVQRFAEVRVHAVVDDDPCALAWGQATQVGQALLGDQDVDVVLGVVDVVDGRYIHLVQAAHRPIVQRNDYLVLP